jgi:membrane protease YdiL (CAAX protease family)
MEFMLAPSESSSQRITFKKAAKEAFQYLKNPRYSVEDNAFTLGQKVHYCFQIYLLQLVFLPFLVPLIYVAKKMTQAEHLEIDQKNWAVVLYIILLGPLLEELVFRGLLRFNRKVIAFWGSLLLGGLGWVLSPNSTFKNASVYMVFMSFPVFYIATEYVKKTLHEFWKNHFKVVFHFVAVSFALIHLGNFTNIHNYLWALPLVSIQLILGYFLGFLRIKFGFWYGVGLHIMWNFTFTIISLLDNS